MNPLSRSVVCKSLQWQQNRGMATLQDIQMRLKSVTSIQKITKSMKMVSASKYNRAEEALRAAKPYGEGSKKLYDVLKLETEPTANTIYIVMSSDKGLCGAIHSGLAKWFRVNMEDKLIPENKDIVKLFCVGDKCKNVLHRTYSPHIIMTAKEVGRKPPTFIDAGELATRILELDFKFAVGKIMYNEFKTVVAYTVQFLPFYAQNILEDSEEFTKYEMEDDLQSYHEYTLASLLFYAFKQGACAEMASRMTAMDNASKNAGEMIDHLTLTYNRTRQAVITRELIEIISGASALEKKD